MIKKPLNRAFALAFTLIILSWMVYQVTSGPAGEGPPGPPWVGALVMYGTFMIGYPIIVFGLLSELRKPTLSFNLESNPRWLVVGAFLLGIFALVNLITFTQRHPEEPLSDFFFGTFCMETSSFALMFGILFMTRSTPQRSPSYKVMLIGVVLFEVMVPLFTYLLAAFGIYFGGPIAYKDFWGQTVNQLWFWWDFTSEVVILAAALWLLRRGKS